MKRQLCGLAIGILFTLAGCTGVAGDNSPSSSAAPSTGSIGTPAEVASEPTDPPTETGFSGNGPPAGTTTPVMGRGNTRLCESVPAEVRPYFRGYRDTGENTLLAMMYVAEGNNPGENWWLVISSWDNTWLTNIPGSYKPSGDQLIANPGDSSIDWPPEKLSLINLVFFQLKNCPLYGP